VLHAHALRVRLVGRVLVGFLSPTHTRFEEVERTPIIYFKKINPLDEFSFHARCPHHSS
jgi:hypothetical protein